MNLRIKLNSETALLAKILFIVGTSFLAYLIVNFLFIRWASYGSIKNNLKQINTRIIKDLIYRNGKWDTSFYVNDDNISQENPLYIITTDGFIIDREKPINGFLDTANFQYSSSFTTPSTIITPAGEQWRMYSKAISQNGTQSGSIVVGYYQPELSALTDIDNQLQKSADIILGRIKIMGGTLDVGNIDTRNINIKISYEIVDKYNRTFSSVGGLPSFIDKSYLPDVLRSEYSTVIDKKTNTAYLIFTMPFIDSSQNIVAVIVNGYSLAQINNYLHNQLVFSMGSGLVVIILMLVLLSYLLRSELIKIIKQISENLAKTFPFSQKDSTLRFDKDNSVIYFTEQAIKIPYNSIQYGVCKVLFSNLKKRWENDEIVEKVFPEVGFEETGKYWRKVYDAIGAINEKSQQVFGFDIVLFEAKTCRINPNMPSTQPQSSDSN